MKEASGEANLTVVTIILIGVIVAVVTPLITTMMENTKAKAECMNAGESDCNSQSTLAKYK